MTTWRRALMELPAADRLEQALHWLEEMTGTESDVVAAQAAYRLSPAEARVVVALRAAAPRVLTKQQLYQVLYPLESNVAIKMVDVVICHARRVLPAGAIKTHWGVGFSMPVPLVLPDAPPSVVPARSRVLWTADEDDDLLRMYRAGSSWSVMAEEMDRSPRSLNQRMQALREMGRFVGPIRRVENDAASVPCWPANAAGAA